MNKLPISLDRAGKDPARSGYEGESSMRAASKNRNKFAPVSI